MPISDGRYAAISKARMQVSSFSDNPNAYNPDSIYIVDLQDHPQKDEVQVDWFYDNETNEFSAEGEIHYPEPEPEPEIPLSEYQVAALETANNVDYLVCLAELNAAK